MRLIQDLNKDGMTIVFVTHDPRMSKFAGTVVNMQDGKLININQQEPEEADDSLLRTQEFPTP